MNNMTMTRRMLGLSLMATAAAPRATFAVTGASQIYYLAGGKVLTAAIDGSGARELVDGGHGGINDGIAFDPVTKRLFWTNMGKPAVNDGFIQSANLDGSDLQMVVPIGGTFTPKQLKIDVKGRKLYWSDREGLRVMRANIDGSNIEVLLQTGGDDDRKKAELWCVGMALDLPRGQIYWTQKGGDHAHQGTINRMNIKMPEGQTATARTDIEVLFAGLPEPVDLDFDLARRTLYWSDRADNTINRAPMDPPSMGSKGFDPKARTDSQVLVHGLDIAVGIFLDLPNRRMVYGDMRGHVGVSGMDGSGAKFILENQGSVTGIILL